MNGKHFLPKSLALAAALLAVLLASCNFWNKSDDLEPVTPGTAEPQYCTITGSVSQTGAYPSSLASSGSRTALPSFSDITYSVSATDGTQTISGNIDLGTHSFEVRIPVTAENVNWTVTINGTMGAMSLYPEAPIFLSVNHSRRQILCTLLLCHFLKVPAMST